MKHGQHDELLLELSSQFVLSAGPVCLEMCLGIVPDVGGVHAPAHRNARRSAGTRGNTLAAGPLSRDSTAMSPA